MKKGYKLNVFNRLSDWVYPTEAAALDEARQIKATSGLDFVEIVEVNLDAENMTPEELHTWSTDDLIKVKRNIQDVLNERAMNDEY